MYLFLEGGHLIENYENRNFEIFTVLVKVKGILDQMLSDASLQLMLSHSSTAAGKNLNLESVQI